MKEIIQRNVDSLVMQSLQSGKNEVSIAIRDGCAEYIGIYYAVNCKLYFYMHSISRTS